MIPHLDPPPVRGRAGLGLSIFLPLRYNILNENQRDILQNHSNQNSHLRF